jgi:methionine-rich copper-binding protein CopC
MKKRLSFGLLVGVALAVGLVLLGRASPAFAHADYESSTPAKDEVVASPPAQLDAYFTQELARQEGRYFLRVFNEQETQVSQGDGTIDDLDRTHMFTTLQPDLPAGRYIVRWATLSDEDVEADEGAFCFYVAVQPTADQQAECAALAGEEEGPTPTAAAAVTPTQAAAQPMATQTAGAPTATPGGTTEDDDDGAPTGLIIAGAVAGAAVALAAVGGVAIWLRRTLQ